ncbi:hypothetical protein D3C78_1459650 [compost metagenome]
MLEHVDVQRAFLQCQVRAHVVGELHQLHAVALLFQQRLDLLLHLVAEVANGGADGDFLFRRVGSVNVGRSGQADGGNSDGFQYESAHGVLLVRVFVQWRGVCVNARRFKLSA